MYEPPDDHCRPNCTVDELCIKDAFAAADIGMFVIQSTAHTQAKTFFLSYGHIFKLASYVAILLKITSSNSKMIQGGGSYIV